jgi:beta-lactamase class A
MLADPTPATDLERAVRRIVEEYAEAAGDPDASVVSVWLAGLAGDPVLDVDGDAVHYAASTMKLPLLVAAYRRHERGEIDLDTEVAVHNEFSSAADFSPFSLDPDEDQDDETWAALGGTRSLRRLARQMIVDSGNLATNLLLERVGAGEVASVLMDAGCSPETVIVRGIEDAVARRSGLDNLVTARDLGVVLRGVADRTLAEPETCAAIEAVLAGQRHRNMIPAGLPAGTFVANKTGWVAGVSHDVALVRPAGLPPYLLSVCTTLPVPEETAAALVARISAAVWAEWVR